MVEVLIEPTLEVGSVRPLSQLDVGSALRPIELTLGIRPMASSSLD